MAVARLLPQQIRNTHQWSNWEAVFSTRSGEDILVTAFFVVRATKQLEQ
jgi:hypothetical protein